MQLNVNTDAAIQLTAKLEKLHKSAFPSAVRNTLNDAAFKTKKLIPEKASKNFTVRQKNLFSRFTKVEKASGWEVNNMVSKIGIDGGVPKGGKVAEGLAKQETGGTVDGRKLTPHNMGRTSNSYQKKLKSKNQFSKMGQMATNKKRPKGAKYILIKNSDKGTVFEIKGKKLSPVFNYRTTTKTRLKSNPFISPSAKEAAKEMESLYIKNAEYQLKKHLR